MLNNIICILILFFNFNLKTADSNEELDTGANYQRFEEQIEGARQITIKVLFYTVTCFCCSNIEELSITVSSNLTVQQVKEEIVRKLKSKYQNLNANDFDLNDSKGQLKNDRVIGSISLQPSLFIALK